MTWSNLKLTKKILFLILLICKKGSKLVDMFLVGRRTQKHLLEINTSPFAIVGSDNSSRKTKKNTKNGKSGSKGSLGVLYAWQNYLKKMFLASHINYLHFHGYRIIFTLISREKQRQVGKVGMNDRSDCIIDTNTLFQISKQKIIV